MSKVIFGVWDGKVIDNRGKRIFEIDDTPGFDNFDVFDPGNPIKAFLGWKGFFIFEENVNLLEAAVKYLEKCALESCGACTPCRVGTNIMKEKLQELLEGRADESVLDELETLAEHIRTTSRCGLGQTSTIAVQELLTFYRQEIRNQLHHPGGKGKQNHTTYVTAPCIEACPARVNVPQYIDYIRDGKLSHSASVILQKYPLAETCGRVCVKFCEYACTRNQVDQPLGIKLLKKFAAENENYISDKWFNRELIREVKPGDLRIAVVGAGPAGVTAAYHLLLKGYHVDVFEAHSEPGGMAMMGIPNYRLPMEVLKKEIGIIETLGARIFYGKRMGQDFSVDTLFEQGYKSVFLGIGAHSGRQMKIPGEHRSMKGYKSGINFLLYINHYFVNRGLQVDIGRKIAVVGGGNVAMDCARSAVRMGVEEVHLIYRRTRDEMPADPEEVEAAEKEGIIFHFLTHPVQILSDENGVKGLRLIRMELGKPDPSGRRSVTTVDNSEFDMDIDFIVPAIGQKVDPGFLSPDDRIELDKWGLIGTDPVTLETSRKGVFAGGDCSLGPATLIEAMGQGLNAAESIDNYLSHGRVLFSPEKRMSTLVKEIDKLDTGKFTRPVRSQLRIIAEELDPEIRKKIFREVEQPITMEQAYREADRCLRCYRTSLVITER